MDEKMQDAILNLLGDDLILIRRNWPCVSEKLLGAYCEELAEHGIFEIVDEDEFEVKYRRAA